MTLKQKVESLYQFKSIQPEVSNELVTGDLFETGSFLKHSKTICPKLRHEFLEVSKDGSVLGMLYFQIMPFKGSELKSYLPDQEAQCLINKTMEAIVDLALERVNWSLAVLGNVFITGDNGQYLVKNINDKERWGIIQEATNHISKQTKIDAFLISDLRSEVLKGKEKLLADGYRVFEVEPDLIFNIDQNWENFEDYLDSIVSKYRVRTKKVLEKSQQLEVKDFNMTELKENEQDIYALYKNVVAGASFKLAEIEANYFHDFKQAYPNIFFVRGFYLDKALVGVISYFAENDALRINFVGLNYTYNKTHSIYQRVLYDCIEQGILLQKKSIHFGRTASEIKTSVGAYPVKTFALLKHNNKLPNLAIKPLTSYLKPEPFQIRNPFKAKKAV